MNFIERFAASSLQTIRDGRWHNLCTHERQDGGDSIFAVWREWLGFGCAQALGWVVVDETWARLTPKGAAALRVSDEQPKAEDRETG